MAIGRDYTIGHQWAPRPGVVPAVVLVVEVRGRYPNHLNRVTQTDSWILDYEFTPHGRGRTFPNGSWLARPAASAHVYPPRALFWEDTRGSTGVRHSAWVYFDGGAVAGLGRLVDPRRHFARIADETGEIGAAMQQIARAGQEQGEKGYWAAQAWLCRALDIVVSAERVEAGRFRVVGSAERAKGAGLVERVEELARADPAGRMTLARIAARLHVSVSQLSHRYRETAGQTPMAALTRRRIDHARLLILKGIPLKTVADQLGFSDAFHLSKVFKRVEGRSPRQFVREARAGVPR